MPPLRPAMSRQHGIWRRARFGYARPFISAPVPAVQRIGVLPTADVRTDASNGVDIAYLDPLLIILRLLVSGRVTGEDKVASFGGLVAGEAGFVHRLVARFAVRKISKSPAARRGVFF